MVHGYRAVRCEIPSGWAAGCMPELKLLCEIAGVSMRSEHRVTKPLVVEITPSHAVADAE